MNSQKKYELRLRKSKAKRKAHLGKRRDNNRAIINKQNKQSEDLEREEEQSKRLYFRFKMWIVESIFIRILNIFRNLFRKKCQN